MSHDRRSMQCRTKTGGVPTVQMTKELHGVPQESQRHKNKNERKEKKRGGCVNYLETA